MHRNTSSLQQPASQIDAIPQDIQSSSATRQQIYLEKFIARYTERTKTSKQLTQAYRFTLADSRNAADFSLPLKEMCYPIVGKQSQGSRIWYVDGNGYIDVVMGFGIKLFGQNPPCVKTAL